MGATPIQFSSFQRFDLDSPFDIALQKTILGIRELKPSVVVMAEGFEEGELQQFLNRLNGPVHQKLNAQELPYQRVGTTVLRESVRVELYRRQGDPTGL